MAMQARRARTWTVAGALLALTVAGCSPVEVVIRAKDAAAAGPSAAPTAPASASARPLAGGTADAPSWDIPPIVVPDVTALTSGAAAAFSGKLAGLASPASGVSVTAARCDGTGRVVTRGSLTEINNNDGSGSIGDGDSTIVSNHGDGSGVYADGSLSIQVNADGSGFLHNGTLSINVNADGTGAYDNDPVHITVTDHLSSYKDDVISVINDGKGGGSLARGTVTVVNNGDGSGGWTDGTTYLQNNGDGTGTVDGRRQVAMAPLAPLPKPGRFPRVQTLAPVGRDCGTLIRLQDQVLFDLDQAVLRPEAGPVLDDIAAALRSTPGSLQVNGHTDATGDDAHNLDLSRRRAAAVEDGLRQRGVTNPITATGNGSSQPIAANEIGGRDNPEGRRLNRRVEIVVSG